MPLSCQPVWERTRRLFVSYFLQTLRYKTACFHYNVIACCEAYCYINLAVPVLLAEAYIDFALYAVTLHELCVLHSTMCKCKIGSDLA